MEENKEYREVQKEVSEEELKNIGLLYQILMKINQKNSRKNIS